MHSAWGTASPEICATRADNSEGAGGRGVGASSRAAHLTNFFVFLMWSHCSFVRRGGPALAHISPEASCASESSRARPNRPVGELCDAVRGLGSGASTPQRWRPEVALAGTGQLQGSAAGRLVAASGRAEESARLEARRRPPSSRDRARDMTSRSRQPEGCTSLLLSLFYCTVLGGIRFYRKSKLDSNSAPRARDGNRVNDFAASRA